MFDAILQFGPQFGVVEVDEQSNLHAGQFHVSQQLGFVKGVTGIPLVQGKKNHKEGFLYMES